MYHLHLHSKFSLQDSIIRPEELVARLNELGHKGAAITDHGNLYAGVSIYKMFKENNLKYIHGIEFYICSNVYEKNKGSAYYHLIALAKNEQGRKNLNRLVTISENPECKYYKPRIDFSLLSMYKDGLIICSACLAGELSKYLMEDKYDKARETAQQYKEKFGEDYYIEIQSRNDKDQIKVNQLLVKLAKELDIGIVVTTDAHYVLKDDQKYQNIYAFGGKYAEEGESYTDCYVQSEEEVREKLSYLPKEIVDEAINNTDIIADKCSLEMPLSAPILPEVKTPKQFRNNKEWLEHLCYIGGIKKLQIDFKERKYNGSKGMSEELLNSYLERYDYELNALEKMGFLDYILLVYSYSSVGKRRGKGRGSGGGSLINYLTNITDIDPIEHCLYFERFIDVAAISRLESGEITRKELKVPDIDLDFSGDDCKKVLKYLRDTYGEDKVASIGRFGCSYTKGLIRDIGKTMGIDLSITDTIAKSFGSYEISDIDMVISEGCKVPENMTAPLNYVKQYPKLFEYVRKLYGLPKSFGLHPCGKIISNSDLDDFLPSQYDENGIRFLQGDEHDVEDVGLVKVDILGLRTLDQEYDTLEMSNETEEFIDAKQPYNDDKVFDIFRKGDTLGIFQFSSEGMKKTLKKMNVSSIDELSAANALFRPGAMGYIDNFCARKNGSEAVTYLHPDLEPILKNTYGIMVFQEQLIEIGRMAGIHNPDMLRKATGKKDAKLLAKVKPELEEKLLGRGWSPEQFEQLWNDMLEFAKYSFNKCLSGDTTVRTSKHGIVTLAELYKIKEPVRILSVFPNGKIRYNDLVNITKQEKRDIYRVTLAGIIEIKCTDNHKFPTPNGMKMLKSLNVGDELFVTKSLKNLKVGDEVKYTSSIRAIEKLPPEETYNVTLKDPAHEFIVNNGIVTSNSHSSAYAILAYMTAKQKAYYPTEFFAGLFNSYIGESAYLKDNAEEIFIDAAKHNIKYAPFSFRNDHRKCSVKDGKIIYAIPLIRDMNTSTAEILYSQKDYSGKYFWKLICDLYNSGMRDASFKQLINLGFFSEFGIVPKLRAIYECLMLFDFGTKHNMKKTTAEKIKGLNEHIEKFSTDLKKDGTHGSTWKDIELEKLFSEIEEKIMLSEMQDVSRKVKVVNQKEYIGLAPFPTGNEEDRPILYVTKVSPLCTKATGRQFGVSVFTSSFGSGIQTRFSIKQDAYKKFKEEPISQGDIIKCLSWKNDRGYFDLTSWMQIYY